MSDEPEFKSESECDNVDNEIRELFIAEEAIRLNNLLYIRVNNEYLTKLQKICAFYQHKNLEVTLQCIIDKEIRHQILINNIAAPY